MFSIVDRSPHGLMCDMLFLPIWATCARGAGADHKEDLGLGGLNS